ncbi:cell wall-binding repeat-containing protein [Herbiconiux ginsengi]|uniref:Putative cell wall binding repeat 2 n=1 Tax=Herbiconiux ginsengi TaxID=381665 RepID=A0A1H3SPB4_9MICO|nr:cell wall-binding repeat-containing protein [Herbiconiux ginsengi]SDZ39764.1 Putative cell wall binding repeat 2 [Herbiconiux ginsengi]
MAIATSLFVAATPVFLSAPAFAAGATTTAPATAPTDAGPVASGDDWSVVEVPGGYEVTKTLAEPLEIRSDAPTLWADGEELGIATQSLDGLTLTITTTDPAVADATVIDQGWSGAGDPAIDAPVDRSNLRSLTEQVPLAQADAPELSEDPSIPGQYEVERDDYNLGDEAEDIRGFNRKGEIRAAVWMPVGAPGERPVVVFLHGRHTSCAGAIPKGAVARAWPCYPADEATGYAGQVDVESYLGYNDAAQILASQGYAVVSISANAINALDGSLADDTGAAARAQLVMDHLTLLRETNDGQSVGLPAALTGRLDLDNVGLMGHSRGGEGVVRAALLNVEQGEPFGIKGVLPLAPTDYSRMTLPDVPTAVILPYCDGDVEDQMGQKYIDDSRHAYGDDVLRSSVLVMGTNHNYFNTAWTPGKYPVATSDDWSIMDRNQTDPTCGASAPTRLTADEQYAFGNAYIAGFFRLTLGDEQQFMPMFDGSDAEPASAGRADVRVSATLPTSDRVDIANFDAPDTTIQAVGAGTYQNCESMSPLDVPATLPYCVTELEFAQAPDYGFTSAIYGNGRATSVPSAPSLHFTYSTPASPSAAAGELRVPVPAAATDFSGFEQLSFRVSPDDSVAIGGSTDLTVTLVDGSGGSASVTASQFGDALTVLPGSTNPLRKVLLQQIAVPVSAFEGVDLSDVQQVRFTEPRAAGGVLLSDLSLFTAPTLGTPTVSTRPVVSVPDVAVEEGAGASSVDVPVVLSRPAEEAATVFVSTIPSSSSGKVLSAMQKVEFAPGEVCKVVTVPVQGDSATSTSATASFITNATNTQGGVTIGDSFGKILVREDDGVVARDGTPLPSAPEVGAQGDACAEAAALTTPGTLTVSSAALNRGDVVTVTGSGFRVGESVSLTLGGVLVGTVVSTDGTVSFEATVPADTVFGATVFSATGAGTRFTSLADVTVGPAVDRIGGADRYEVAVNTSKDGFPDGAKTVYVASGAVFPDALSAAPAAAVADAPVLLTAPDSLPAVVKAEIERLDPESIVIVGGKASVSSAVGTALGSIAPVTRLGGADRFAASRAVAAAAFPSGAATAVLATGRNFPDALSAGAAIGAAGPVILVDGSADGLDAATTKLLTDLGVTSIAIAGGEASVSPGIEADAQAIAATVRLGGADRYAASQTINAHFFTSADRVLLATGANFPDALAGSALAPKVGGPLFTVPGTCVPAETLAQIASLGATRVTLLGGVNSLSTDVESLTACAAG